MRVKIIGIFLWASSAIVACSAQTVTARISWEEIWNQSESNSLAIADSFAVATLKQVGSNLTSEGELAGPNSFTAAMFEKFPGFQLGITTARYPLSSFAAGLYTFSSPDLPELYEMTGLGPSILPSPVTITNASSFSTWDGSSPLTIQWTSVAGLDSEDSEIRVSFNRDGADASTSSYGGLSTAQTSFTPDAMIFPAVPDPWNYSYSVVVGVAFGSSDSVSGYLNPFSAVNSGVTSTSYSFAVVPEPRALGLIVGGCMILVFAAKCRRARRNLSQH